MFTKVRITFLSSFKYQNKVLEIINTRVMHLKLPIEEYKCEVTTNIISAENLSKRVQYILVAAPRTLSNYLIVPTDAHT